ncbi:hypothetical protein OROMI_007568 [Orobanche minor]
MNPLLVLLMAFIVSSAIATNLTTTSVNDDITIATREMQKANYFAFVMLVNMAPRDITRDGNGITFLMPNDKTLSKTDMSESSVVDFLLRHSIPSPLLMDHLEHFPTGSMIPTSKPGFVFKVANNGRRRFFLSNVRITSPNICTKGSLIRCHGIDGDVQPEIIPRQPNIQPPTTAPTCFNTSGPGGAAAPSPSSGSTPITASAPPSIVEVGHPESSSPRLVCRGALFDSVMTIFMLVVVGLLWF